LNFWVGVVVFRPAAKGIRSSAGS